MDQDPSEILKLRGQIVHTHFSDCNGEIHGDLPPGRGNTPLSGTSRRSCGRSSTGHLARARIRPAPGPDRRVGDEAYEATAKMMAELGVRAPTAGEKEPATVT